jgi:hypothetical protein
VDGARVSVAVVASCTEEELIVGLLRSNGLRAAVATDDVGGQEPQLHCRVFGCWLPPYDEASACRLLAAIDDAAGAVGGG